VLLRKICQVIARCCAPTYRPPTYCRRSFLPQVTVQFTDEFLKLKGIPYEDNQEEHLGELWEELRKLNPGIRLRPLFSGATGAGRKEFEAFIRWVVSRNRTYKPPNFFALYRIVGPAGTDFLGIAKRVSAAEVGGVRVAKTARVLQPAVGPAVNVANQPRYPYQSHLRPAPEGIDAPAAWARPGGDGTGVRFVDVERGWLLNHEDLPPNLNSPAPVPLPLYGLNDSWAHDHGTPVLGILGAMDDTYGNTVGGVGIAPRAEGYVSSWFEGYDEVKGSELSNHAEAIRVATRHLRDLRFAPNPQPGPTPPVGDVLLLEAQLEDPGNPSMKWPLDTDSGIAAAVGLATAAGIIVVEAGGSGDESGQYFDTDAGSPPLIESGAILVSAGHVVASQIVPWGYAPLGSRVDCFAWGFGINTCWADGGGATSLYTPATDVPPFGGTSAAAAIVAGAAIALQGIARSGAGPLTPAQMRAALRDRAWNTPPADESPGNPYKIGCMPDLAKLIVALDAGTLHALPP